MSEERDEISEVEVVTTAVDEDGTVVVDDLKALVDEDGNVLATDETIAVEGPSVLYGGEVGARLVTGLRAAGSPMALEDLADEFLASEGKTREEFQDELRESAEKAVRAQFVLDAIANQKDVQIGDGELTEYLVRQAARYQMAPQEFANQVMQSGNLPMMVADIRRNKALAVVLQTAAVTDADGKTVDLDALAEAPEPAADDDLG